MSSIGSISFHSTKGNPKPLATRDSEITPNWTDGHAFTEIGEKSETFQINTLSDYDSAAARKTAFEALCALQGTSVSWTDDDGTSWTNVQIVTVVMARKFKSHLTVGGLTDGLYILRCQVEAQIIA